MFCVESSFSEYDTVPHVKQYPTWVFSSTAVKNLKSFNVFYCCIMPHPKSLFYNSVQFLTTLFAVCLLLPPAVKVTHEVINGAMLSPHILHISPQWLPMCGLFVCLLGVGLSNLSAQLHKDLSAVNRCTEWLLTESDNTRYCNNTIWPPEDEHGIAWNMSWIIM